MEEEDILVLTFDVRNLKRALEKFKKFFSHSKEKRKDVRVGAHECLGQVLRSLRTILVKYPLLQSSDLLTSAGRLIQHVKNYKYEDDDDTDVSEFLEAIDQLALTFSSRVSEYLMGDIDTRGHHLVKTKSCENVSGTLDSETRESSVSGSEGDPLMKTYPEVVDIALKQSKLWSQYAHNILNYIETRSQLEADHARKLAKLSQITRPIFEDENDLPFQSIYCSAISYDMENASNCLAVCNALQGHKFTEPLTNRLNDHEKSRKQIKSIWKEELKKMQEAAEIVQRSRETYVSLRQEYGKLHDTAHRSDSSDGLEGSSSKIEKKLSLEEETILKKVNEAEADYKAAVMNANKLQHSLNSVKSESLKQIRELMQQCDHTMKNVTVAYFQLQHTVSAAPPMQYHSLYETSKQYEAGSNYIHFIKTIQSAPGKNIREESEQCRPLSCHMSLKHRNSKGQVTSRQVLRGASRLVSDSESSCNSDVSNKSPESSTRQNISRFVSFSSGDELEMDFEQETDMPQKTYFSKAAATHVFHELTTPSQCRHCDAYICFHGVECSQCGLHCHRKCLEILSQKCGAQYSKKKCRKMTVFGVPLTLYYQHCGKAIPTVVTKCASEIEAKGFFVKGIYRVSGVKSKVEKLCQRFEKDSEVIEFNDAHPTVVATVLKLYLRQLPEPLLTYHLYPEFIRVAKTFPAQREEWSDQADAVNELKHLAHKLPHAHYQTLAYLMHHLKRLSLHAEHNQMPASNLGIVFGPTLLRANDRNATLTSLMDTVHQARATELFIKHAYSIFHLCDDGSFSSADYKEDSLSEEGGNSFEGMSKDSKLYGVGDDFERSYFYRDFPSRSRNNSSDQTTDGSESSAK